MTITYLAERGDERVEVIVASDRGDEAIIRVGDNEFTVRVDALPDGSLAVRADSESRRFRSFTSHDKRWIVEGPRQGGFAILDEREFWLRGGDDADGGVGGKIVASMPGRVVKVEVAVGDEVAAGDVVAVLEAMKMENDVKAKAAGRVTDVHVSAGAAVETGELMIALEPLA